MRCIYCLFNSRASAWIFLTYHDSLLTSREDLTFWSFLVCSCGPGSKNLEGRGVCSILFFVAALKAATPPLSSLPLIFARSPICTCLLSRPSARVTRDLARRSHLLCTISVAVNVSRFDLDWVLKAVWELDMWRVISGWFVGMIITAWLKRNYSNLCFNFYNGFLEKLQTSQWPGWGGLLHKLEPEIGRSGRRGSTSASSRRWSSQSGGRLRLRLRFWFRLGRNGA